MSTSFALVPINDWAHEALTFPHNRQYLSRLENGHLVFDIGHFRSNLADTSSTLATLGRNGDIVLEGGDISKIQCSFKINLKANVVMFCDESRNYTSKVYGQYAPLEYGCPRKIVICQGINYIIGIRGVSSDLYQFELIWYQYPLQTAIERVEERGGFVLEENSHPAETMYRSETPPVSQGKTQFHTTGARQLPDLLGSGTYGEISDAIDLDLGRLKDAQEERSVDGPNVEWHRETALQGFIDTFPTEAIFANPLFHDALSASTVPSDPFFANPLLHDAFPADTLSPTLTLQSLSLWIFKLSRWHPELLVKPSLTKRQLIQLSPLKLPPYFIPQYR
ncbi:hypothetical protein FHL15_009566 [Xylaria flabelliformis]|uniref:Uncharacterized protein n=1 Tax=Xylaria flabelliformis TaxID=2512241 RepID=A0A553HNI5_9PEZI|nr:hypothetical protein FHL15_009566 [Xylaria flabelliformis]